MADNEPSPGPNGSPSIPLKRSLEDDHAPSVSSPLNPDASTRAKASTPSIRSQREKKESLKKRESSAAVRANTPDQPGKKNKTLSMQPPQPSPVRYNHQLPNPTSAQNIYHFKDPLLVTQESHRLFAPDGTELKRPLEHVENKKAFRYTPCIADTKFVHSRYYRSTDDKPYGPRMSFQDSDKNLYFDDSGTMVTNEKGWRMGRANICVREGSFYYEVKIQRGGPDDGGKKPVVNGNTAQASHNPLPHIRMGWARREAPLDAPVGFDGYSYGLTDIRLEPMHKSRAHKFTDAGTDEPSKKASKSKLKTKAKAPEGFAANDHAREGDVIGLEINLPSISLHRKIVDGNYNPAIDVGSGFDTPAIDEESAPNIVRDRFPVPYKGSAYFESIEYRPSKGMDSYGDRGPFSKETPSANHEDATLRHLPHSSINIYKNGKCIGTAFKNLMAFLPPASAPLPDKSVRQGCDDGMLGYFPAISAFSGGVAQVNFGPTFWFPPEPPASNDVANDPNTPVIVKKEEEDTVMADNGETKPAPVIDAKEVVSKLPPRPVSDRYQEQVVEDIFYDILDEVDFFVQDGGTIDI